MMLCVCFCGFLVVSLCVIIWVVMCFDCLVCSFNCVRDDTSHIGSAFCFGLLDLFSRAHSLQTVVRGTMAAASVAQQLRQGKPIDNHHITKLHLLVQLEGAAPCPDVASALLQKARPAPTWVAARTTPEVLEVVMV